MLPGATKVENLGFDQRKQNTTCNNPTPQFSYNKLLSPIFHVIIVKVYDRIYTYIYAVCPSFGLGLGPNPSTQDILIIIINYQVLK